MGKTTTITLQDLRQFTGTTQWYRHSLTGLLYTDGVHFLAEEVQADWIIDLIASYQYRMANVRFQVWTIKPYGEEYVALCQDGDENFICQQVFPFTDLPATLMPLKLFVQNNVLFLPSEY